MSEVVEKAMEGEYVLLVNAQGHATAYRHSEFVGAFHATFMDHALEGVTDAVSAAKALNRMLTEEGHQRVLEAALRALSDSAEPSDPAALAEGQVVAVFPR